MDDEREFRIEGLEWPLRNASRRVDAGGIAWHVQQLGQGPAMLFIHGTGASTHSWASVAELLRSRFSITIVDLPGHGFTDVLPAHEMTLPGIAGKLGQLLGILNIAPRCIVAHSAGAAIAVRMVLDRSIPAPRLIVAVNGAFLPFSGVARWLFPAAARLLSVGSLASHILSWRSHRAGAVRRMLERMGGRVPAANVAYYERLLHRPSHVQAALDMMAMWDLERLWNDIDRLSVPLELIACGDDLAVPAESAWKVAEKAPKAHVRYVRGLGHLAQEERPGEIADAILGAWSEHGDVEPGSGPEPDGAKA